MNYHTIIAKHLNANISPNKIRILTKIIKGKTAFNAIKYLKLLNTKAAFIIKKIIYSALNNAKNNFSIKELSSLKLHTILINNGIKRKKFFPRAKGRVDYIVKQYSHIIIELINDKHLITKR